MQPENTSPNQPTPPTTSPPVPPTSPAPPVDAPLEPTVVAGAITPEPPQAPKKSGLGKNKKKLLFGGLLVALLLLGGTAGAMYMSSNNPDKLWSKALTNTSKGYEKLVTYNKDQAEKFKGGTVKGNFKLDGSGVVVDGNLDSKYNGDNSSSKVDVGLAGTRFGAEVLTTVPSGSKNPDIYVKVTGIKGIDALLGPNGGGIGTALSAYDNQWLVIDHTLLDQLEKSATKTESNPGIANLSQQDITAIAEAVGRVNKEYIFTDESSKAVLTVKENVGKETVDGRSVYHYKVGYSKENLKKYATAMKDELNKTKAKEYGVDNNLNDLLTSIDKLDSNGQADVWVDTKTKLIRTVRITDGNNSANVLEVSLPYNGGDEYPFKVAFESKEAKDPGTLQVTATLNTKTNETKLGASVDAKDNNQPVKFKIDATLTPSNDDVQVQKPANAKSLLEVYGQLMGGNAANPLTIPTTPAGSSL